MNRKVALARKKAGRPIESADELFHALNDVKGRTKPETDLWYFMNRVQRTLMEGKWQPNK
jgi:hypothetical protein